MWSQFGQNGSVVFVRGSGIQGNGSSASSSSGMGLVLEERSAYEVHQGGWGLGVYSPDLDGLSSEAGTGTGIWGYDVHAGQESSVGALMYLPAP